MTVGAAASGLAFIIAAVAILHALGGELLGWLVCRFWRWRFKRAEKRGHRWRS